MSNLIHYVVAIQKATIATCSVLIALTFGAVVVLRYGFQANLFAYEEWMLVAAFILYFIGAAQGSYDNTHIKADLMNELIASPKGRRRLGLFVMGLEVAICAILTWWAFWMVAEDIARYPLLPATPVYKIPLAVPRGTIFIGFFLMTTYAAMHFIRMWGQDDAVDLETATGEKS